MVKDLDVQKGDDDEVDDDVYSPYNIPPDIALAGYSFSDPTTLDEALRGPNITEWLKALMVKLPYLALVLPESKGDLTEKSKD